MTIHDVFNVCRARGVRLCIQGAQLRAQGRPGAVHEPLHRGLVEHRQQIIENLGEGVWQGEGLPGGAVAGVSPEGGKAVSSSASVLHFPTPAEARRRLGKSASTWQSPADFIERGKALFET
jgi:hypothetical protein